MTAQPRIAHLVERKLAVMRMVQAEIVAMALEEPPEFRVADARDLCADCLHLLIGGLGLHEHVELQRPCAVRAGNAELVAPDADVHADARGRDIVEYAVRRSKGKGLHADHAQRACSCSLSQQCLEIAGADELGRRDSARLGDGGSMPACR